MSNFKQETIERQPKHWLVTQVLMMQGERTELQSTLEVVRGNLSSKTEEWATLEGRLDACNQTRQTLVEDLNRTDARCTEIQGRYNAKDAEVDFWKDKAGQVAAGTVQIGHSLGDANVSKVKLEVEIKRLSALVNQHVMTIGGLKEKVDTRVYDLQAKLDRAKRAEKFWENKADTMAADRARITNELADHRDENAALIKALNIVGAILGPGQTYGIKRLIALAKGEKHE